MKQHVYEQIGAWNVSLALPWEARNGLKRYFAELRGRRVPLPTIFSSDGLLTHFTGFHIPPTTTKEDIGQFILESAEKLIPGIKSYEGETYLEHRAKGGSMMLPDNPFVPYSKLYGGVALPVKDFRTKPPVGFGQPIAPNPLVMEDGITVFSNGDAWWWINAFGNEGILRAWKSYQFPVPKEAYDVKPLQTFKFRAVMDWESLEARIDPLPKSSKS